MVQIGGYVVVLNYVCGFEVLAHLTILNVSCQRDPSPFLPRVQDPDANALYRLISKLVFTRK